MPIFISYSQKDSAFVDNLAKNLVAAKHHIWMDRWELALGDSLTQKIENALTDASAMLVILSANSVESDWCRRELSAGLVRELEERKVVVMPCVIDDCKIPLFLRDKLYADFRRDPDEAFNLVDRSLSKISNPFQGRVDHPNFHTDWSIEWGIDDRGERVLRWTFIDHGHDWPYVVLTECRITCNGPASNAMAEAIRLDRLGQYAERVMGKVFSLYEQNPQRVILTNQLTTYVIGEAFDGREKYSVQIGVRRLGEDNGMDTIVYIENHLKMAHLQTAAILSGKPASQNA